MPIQSKVHRYKPEEISLNDLAAKAFSILHKKPFVWQLEIAFAILCGEDVIIDVGTGSGKTLCFSLPLILNDTDMVLTVSPLTALMIDQETSAPISTVAVCAETMAIVGAEKLYVDILAGKFREVIVSPEIAKSKAFHRAVLSKDKFSSALRAVCIDEAHCISFWGGSFRPDYADLGILRGRIAKNVPFTIASATLPEHILDDIKCKLRLSKDAKVVQLTNARPNVALSCRTMRHSEESKADLRFLIPKGASMPEDIDITLVYCNQRTACEDAVDRLHNWARDEGIPESCIAFYHAKIGSKRKRELEEKLRNGEIRILVCTDAVGMGCDMRNIQRVVLWGLPPSFCALVQRAGRAGRDFKTLSEAILVVSKSVAKSGTTETEVENDVEEAVVGTQAENRSEEEELVLNENGVDLMAGHEEVNAEGVRVAHAREAEDSEPEDEPEVKVSRKKKFAKDCNIMEARYLTRFVCTTRCRRLVWDEFFQNSKKLQLIFPTNTTYQPLPGARCCDICTPRLFPIEEIMLDKAPGLKRGKKKKVPKAQEEALRNGLVDWRDDELVESYWPGTTSLSGQSILGDDVIEKLATCGERVETYQELRRHIRWAIGHDEETGRPTIYGEQLVAKLSEIYVKFDKDTEVAQQQLSQARTNPTISTADFYSTNTRRTHQRTS